MEDEELREFYGITKRFVRWGTWNIFDAIATLEQSDDGIVWEQVWPTETATKVLEKAIDITFDNRTLSKPK